MLQHNEEGDGVAAVAFFLFFLFCDALLQRCYRVVKKATATIVAFFLVLWSYAAA
jgi:hypothetical protein